VAARATRMAAMRAKWMVVTMVAAVMAIAVAVMAMAMAAARARLRVVARAAAV